jgi:diguanylate cyclase (GGDEF)-like protein
MQPTLVTLDPLPERGIAAGATSADRLAACRVLIVDDSDDDAHFIARALGSVHGGWRFARVDSADEMARALADHDWDLIISDHQMPAFDSLGALEVLKRSQKDIPFIIYSGRIEEDRGVVAMRGGASDFVEKGSPEKLLAVVERELENRRTRRAKEVAERSVVQLANYDELTGLPNRSLFSELVQLRLLDDSGSSVQAALYFLDLDRFMRINDSFGYPTGDALIRQVAARLQSLAGERHLVARLGQDEFAVFVDDIASIDDARRFAERLMRRFGSAFVQNGQDFFLTASIGLSVYPSHGTDPQALLKNAESAVFEAKKQGRNNFQVYRNDLNSGSSRRFRLESDLRLAAGRQQLFLLYQPVVDIRTRAVVSAEALIRWHHPELGLVPADEFIGLADESGVIVDIGDWVLRTALREAQGWHRAGFPDIAIAVNFSAAQFKERDLAARVDAALRDTGMPGHALEMEITETVAMQNAESTIATLRALKRMGVRISIDDFGTGYSSLSYLKRFPIDILKVDKSFVRDIAVDSDDAAIVRTIAALGRTLKLMVVAEGVETQGQVDFLAAEGCDRMQGYLFSRPVESSELLALMQRATLPGNRPADRAAG